MLAPHEDDPGLVHLAKSFDAPIRRRSGRVTRPLKKKIAADDGDKVFRQRNGDRGPVRKREGLGFPVPKHLLIQLSGVLLMTSGSVEDQFRAASDQARAQYRPNLIAFYSPFFPTVVEAEQFVDTCHARMAADPTPARVLHNVERLIGLADDVLTLKRGRDTHLVFFTIVCVEAIHQLANPDSNLSKLQIVVDFFTNWVSADDQADLQKYVTRSAADDRWVGARTAALSMEQVARIFNAVRNDFVHEGVAWNFHFGDADRTPTLNILELKEQNGEPEQRGIYEISLTGEEYRAIIVRGAIRLIQSLV